MQQGTSNAQHLDQAEHLRADLAAVQVADAQAPP